MSGNPPAPWLNASRSDGQASATPLVINAAAASSGACIGTVPSPKNRRGSTAHRDTMNSLIHRHRSRPACAGTA